VFTGNISRLRTYYSADTLNNRFQPTNPYNIWMPLGTAALNADDGFLLGLGFKYTGVDGFRKLPYSTSQSLLVTHAFASEAFRIQYTGEWIDAIGKADVVLKADLQGPANKTNFFGRGNETVFNKNGDYHYFYRARYDLYNFNPALRWSTGKRSNFSAGPAFQLYHYDVEDNNGRFIASPQAKRFTYDSLTFDRSKTHLGLLLNFTANQRDNDILPKKGFYFSVDLSGFKGLNNDANSYLQIKPEFTVYQKLNTSGTIVISDRIGGGITAGKPEFYQSLYLGGQGNLLGYLKNRFAGQQIIFNNLQGRVKLFDIASYILPGQFGLSGFYDTGRVWVKGEDSDKWHQGVGGGLYFVPAGLTVLQVLAGHSEEGWYPYISLNFRL
jgi:outer membrane protein assembly factor BamA